MDKLSIIVPCYNEDACIELFYQATTQVLSTIQDVTYELWFVDDGSSDTSLPILKTLHLKDKHCHYLSFSRNFGKEAAMLAGLEAATGDYIVFMDADMQDPPSLLPTMLGILKEGVYDSVATKRSTRKGEPILRSFFAHMFYKVMRKISDIEIMDGARDYRMMTRRFADGLLSLKEDNRFSKGLFGWVGYKTKWLPFENVERVAGTSKWSFLKLLSYSIKGIVSLSIKPLKLAGILGIGLFSISILLLCILLLCNVPIKSDFLLLETILVLSSIQMMLLAILGQYISQDHVESKKRPIYIIKERDDTYA